MLKRNQIKFKTLVLLAFLLTIGNVNAQDSLEDVRIVVLGDANIVLTEAIKVDYNPQVDPPKLNPPTLTYPLDDKKYKTKPEIIPARAQTYNTKENEKLYGNYTRLGFGMYQMPLFETYLNNTRSKNLDYGMRYKFLSGEYKPLNQLFTDHDAGAHFTYNISPLSNINVHGGYLRNRINWYGFSPDSNKVGMDTSRNVYNNISVGGSYVKKGKALNDFTYGGGLDYYFQNDKFGNKENYLSLNGEVKKMVKAHLLTLPLRITTTSFGKDTVSSRLFVDLNPRWFLDYGRLTLNVGFNSTLYHDSTGGKLHWFPYADFKVKLIENKLIAHMGIERGLMQNTYASIIKQNPFIDTSIDLKYTNVKSRLFLGIWGSISSKAAFGVEADLGNYINMPMFLGDTSVLRKYKVIYDNVDIFNVKATLQLQWAEAFKSTLEFGYHNYHTDDQKYYWNMPNIDAKLNFQYNYRNKFTAKVTGYYLGERYGKNFEYRDSTKVSLNNDAVKLPAIIDLNIALEYRYNKMIAVFLNGNNLTNQAYRRWLNYPVYKLAILGGVAFTF